MKLLKLGAALAALLLTSCVGVPEKRDRELSLFEGLSLKEALPAPAPAPTPGPRHRGGAFDAPRPAVKMYGRVWMQHRAPDGRVLLARETPNLVVDAGKAAVAGLINGVITNFFEHVAIGTGATAPAAGDTACQTEIASGGGSRAAGTTSRVTTDTTNDTAQVELTYNFTASFAVTESCLLDSITTGTLLSRQTFSAINVANGDSLLIRWKIDVD